MIIIKSKKEIELMRQGGKLLAQIMERLGELVVPGKNTFEINKLARKLVFDIGGSPIFEGYGDPKRPYPAAICASINNEVVHSIPSRAKVLKEGDILKIDIGMRYEGLVTDMTRTYAAGKLGSEAQKLLNVTREALDLGIGKIKAGARLSDYSRAVEGYAKANGFSVVRDLVGHGVGRELHEDPQIPNYFFPGMREIILQEGMTLALEPMINAGTHYVKVSADDWTYITKDGKLSAQFEDTIVVTKNGAEILTRI
ncbi:MAG: type I methionyl aminopeptidase [Candidatus Moraniibacteriota bacterium]